MEGITLKSIFSASLEKWEDLIALGLSSQMAAMGWN